MSKGLTEIEAELVEDIYLMGAIWMVRQPNGDLMAFKSRPVRQNVNDKRSPWIAKHGGAVRATDRPIIVSKESSDFPRIHKTATQPTSVLDVATRHNMSHLWEDEYITV